MDWEKKYNKLMQQYINAIDGFITVTINLEEAEKEIERLNKLINTKDNGNKTEK